MPDRVESQSPRIRHQREQDLAGIQDCRHGAAEHRHPAVFARLPEGKPPRRPFLLHAPVERIIEVRRVAKGELAAAEQDPSKTGDHHGRKDHQPENRTLLNEYQRPARNQPGFSACFAPHPDFQLERFTLGFSTA